jgi:hypothetical protein
LAGVKRLLIFLYDVAKLSVGAAAYVVKGATPGFAYQAMVELYCLTAGYSNDLLSGVIRVVRPRYRLASCDGVLGTMDDARLESIARDLRVDGYHVFEQKLAPEVCDELLALALQTRCRVRAMDSHPTPTENVLYDRNNPLGVRYDFEPKDLLDHPAVQNIMADESILAVAQEYLGCAPVLDIVSMWWHTAFSKDPDKSAAQYYHFDMDRVKWVKLFFCITDVTPESGPHCFVAGSHRRGATPKALLKKGYARLNEADVRSHFPDDRFIEFTAPRGTIVAEDTRGLHKGKHVVRGDRLMFEIEFANSLFGGALPKDRLENLRSEKLAAVSAQYPRVYRVYLDEPKAVNK